jgi:hypothetical protein
MQVKLQAEDIEAVLMVVAAYRGECAGSPFTDRSRATLRPFFAAAILSCEAALREQRQRPAPKVAKRSASSINFSVGTTPLYR